MTKNDDKEVKPEEEEEEEEEEGDDSGSGAEETEQEPEDVGVLAKDVDELVKSEKWHAAVQKANETVLQSNTQESFFDTEGKVPENVFLGFLSRFRTLQKQRLAASKWVFHPLIHRHANIIPYDDNAMRDHVGSWMGNGIGMMQWPVGSKKYNELLQKIIIDNNVGAIVALGPQDPNERTKMVSYWETLGASFSKADDVPGDESYRLTLPGGHVLLVIRVIKWEDFGVPTAEQLALFEHVFDFLRNLQSQKDKPNRVIFHCRAGVGRSGTFYLMYKAFLGLVTKDNLFYHWVALRYMRVETIQTVHQLNFAINYVNSILPGDQPALILTPSDSHKSPNVKQVDVSSGAPPPAPVPGSESFSCSEEICAPSGGFLDDEEFSGPKETKTTSSLQLLNELITTVNNFNYRGRH